MGYLKLTTSDIRMKAKVTPLPRSGEVNLRARRLAPPPANGKAHLPGADQLALAQIAQRFAPGSPAPGGFAPGSQPQAAAVDQRFETRQQAPQVQSAQAAAAPIAASPRGMRTLIGVLILVALLPSALFAAMISFGAIHLNWPAPWPKTQAATWPSAPASVAGALPQEKPQAQPRRSPSRSLPPRRSTQRPRPKRQPSAPAVDPEPRPVKTLTVGPAPEAKPEAVAMASTEPVPRIDRAGSRSDDRSGNHRFDRCRRRRRRQRRASLRHEPDRCRLMGCQEPGSPRRNGCRGGVHVAGRNRAAARASHAIAGGRGRRQELVHRSAVRQSAQGPDLVLGGDQHRRQGRQARGPRTETRLGAGRQSRVLGEGLDLCRLKGAAQIQRWQRGDG